MSSKIKTAANVLENEINTVATKAPRAKKSTVKKVAKIITEEVLEATPAKEKTPRVAKIDKVQNEVCKQFGITGEQFWKFMAKHKPGKMNNNKFADALVQRAFFEREKLAEQLQG